MPFKSRAQLRKFASLVRQGKMSQRVFNEWLRATPNVKALPERIGRKKSKKYAKRNKR